MNDPKKEYLDAKKTMETRNSKETNWMDKVFYGDENKCSDRSDYNKEYIPSRDSIPSRDPDINLSSIKGKISNMDKKMFMLDKKISNLNNLVRQMVIGLEDTDTSSEQVDDCLIELKKLKDRKKKIASNKFLMEECFNKILCKLNANQDIMKLNLEKEMRDKERKIKERKIKERKIKEKEEKDILDKIKQKDEEIRQKNEEIRKKDEIIKNIEECNKACNNSKNLCVNEVEKYKAMLSEAASNKEQSVLKIDFPDQHLIEKQIRDKIKNEEEKKRMEKEYRAHIEKDILDKIRMEEDAANRRESERKDLEKTLRGNSCKKIDMDKMCVFM